jgi:hypothetical protein
VSVSLFTSQTPAIPNVSEASPVTVGNTLTFSVAGTASGARVYAPTTVGAGTFEAALWEITAGDPGGAGTLKASAVFGALTPGAWNTVLFSGPVTIDPAKAYVIGLRTSEGRYAATGGLFATALVNSPITGIKDASAAGGFGNLVNGRFTSGLVNYPTSTFGSNGYFIDVLFDPSGADVLLAASLVANGNMSVALAPQPRLAASLVANGNLTAALSTSTTLAASLSATGTLSVSLNVPTGPADLIATPVAEELMACFTEKLAELPIPPKYIQMRVGQETGPLLGPNVDECCSGLAWVRIAGVYPSWDSFPSPDNDWTPCGPLAYAVQLELGMAFCMPWASTDDLGESYDPPSTADWQQAMVTQMQHQNLMRQTVACCFRPTQRRAVGEWSPLPVEGGCTGGKLLVTVSVMNPCSDC